MKEWCLLHPWMTFFILILIIWLIIENIFVIIRGKKNNMENIRIKGGIQVENNSKNKGSGNGSQRSDERRSINGGVKSVPTTSAPPPPPPPKQD